MVHYHKYWISCSRVAFTVWRLSQIQNEIEKKTTGIWMGTRTPSFLFSCLLGKLFSFYFPYLFFSWKKQCNSIVWKMASQKSTWNVSGWKYGLPWLMRTWWHQTYWLTVYCLWHIPGYSHQLKKFICIGKK